MGRRPRCSAGMRSHCALHRMEMGRVPTLMTVLPPSTSTRLGHIGLEAPRAARVSKPCWRPFLVPALFRCARLEGYQGGRRRLHTLAWTRVGCVRGRREGRMAAWCVAAQRPFRRSDRALQAHARSLRCRWFRASWTACRSAGPSSGLRK